MKISAYSRPACAHHRRSHSSPQPGKTAEKLVSSLTRLGIEPERIVTDPADQLHGWQNAIDFVEDQQWERKPDIGSLYHYRLSEGDNDKVVQDILFVRRDGELIIETVDGAHGQRVYMARDGSVRSDTGLVPLRSFRSLCDH